MHHLVYVEPRKQPSFPVDPPPQQGQQAANVHLDSAVQLSADHTPQGLPFWEEAELLDLLHNLRLRSVQFEVEICTAGEGHLHVLRYGVPQVSVGNMESAVDIHRGGSIDQPEMGVALQGRRQEHTARACSACCSHVTPPNYRQASMLERTSNAADLCPSNTLHPGDAGLLCRSDCKLSAACQQLRGAN